MKKVSFLYFLLFQVAYHAIGGISDGVTEKLDSFKKFYKENYQEIIYAHTDKDFYLAGETIKVKVFCLERLTETPSRLSRVAYLEILDKENISHVQARIELIDGSGWGELYIPTNLNSSNFVLRGYTRWMRNFGPQTFYHTLLPIVNPFKRLGLPPVSSRNEFEIQFYPESGNLINEVETDVIFEIRDENGNPADVTGRLMANDTILVREFSSKVNGTGKFRFTPNIFHKYHVELIHHNGDTTRHPFPAITGKGLGFHVENQAADATMHVFCNDQSIVDASEKLSLIIYQKGEILKSYNFTLNKGRSVISFDKSNLQDGIYNLGLLNSKGEILMERAVLKQTQPLVNEMIALSSGRAGLRDKITIDLSPALAGIDGEDLDISLSVSTSDNRISSHPLNLKQYLLLDNALTGVVYNVAEYFKGQPAEVEQNINNLLIMHKSSKSNWQTITEFEEPTYIPEYRRPIITGTVTDKSTGEPVAGVTTYLSIPGKNIRFYTSRSRYQGSLTFEIDDFYGGNEIVVQNDYTKDTIYSIEIDYPFSKEYVEAEIPALDVDESMAEFIRQQSQNMQVEYAYQQYKPKLPTLTVIDSSSFYYEPDKRYYLDDYTRFVVMEEVMREYIAGINVRHNRNGFHFMTIDEPRNIVYEDNPLMLLDGIPIFDADEIIALDPLKIEKIETVRQRFHKGYLDCKGIVTYTSYEGDLAGHTINGHAMSFQYDGIQTRKQYAYPTYNSAYERNSRIPDYRNTLCWQPNLALSKENSSQIEIFTSDYQADYEIRIEGISPDGKVVTAKMELQVSDNPNP